MAFNDPKFKDISMESSYMKVHIGLSRFNSKFRRAQEWLEEETMRKMAPFVPYKTGRFLQHIQAANDASVGDGKVITVVPPQGRRLYPGISDKGIPFKWTNPQTKPMWGEYVALTYKQELTDGVRRILKETDK